MFGTLIDERPFYSSEIGDIEVEQHEEGFPIVTIYWNVDNDTMVYDLFADRDENGNEALAINVVRGFANHPLFITLCPLDQDGITKIHTIDYDNKAFIVSPDSLPKIHISEQPIRVVTLPIIKGHAGRQVNNARLAADKVECAASAASWAAAFPVRAGPNFTIMLNGNHEDQFPDIDDVDTEYYNNLCSQYSVSTSRLLNYLQIPATSLGG